MNLIFPSFSCPHPHFYQLSGWGCCGHRAGNSLVLYRVHPVETFHGLTHRCLRSLYHPCIRTGRNLYTPARHVVEHTFFASLHLPLLFFISSCIGQIQYRTDDSRDRDLPRGFAVRLSVPRVVVMQGPPGDDRTLCPQPFHGSFCGYVPIRPCKAAR